MNIIYLLEINLDLCYNYAITSLYSSYIIDIFYIIFININGNQVGIISILKLIYNVNNLFVVKRLSIVVKCQLAVKQTCSLEIH
jgi:hypothetical protein